MMPDRATNLDDAWKVFDPRPLEFDQGTAFDMASRPDYYTPPPPAMDGAVRRSPDVVGRITQRLLRGTRDTKVFLSGHVGSGKSTELNRLAQVPEIRRRFEVLTFRFEAQEWTSLDSSQVLFRLSHELFVHAQRRFPNAELGNSSKILRELDEVLYGPAGLSSKEGTASAEINLLFFKIRNDLKLTDSFRRKFRDFGESRRSLLQDLLRHVLEAIEEALLRETPANAPAREMLVLIDDLDKVRGPEEQREIFETNLAALLAPRVRIVYTLPTGVLFGENRAEVRALVEHLYPVRILRKAPETFIPEDAFDPERFEFFADAVRKRASEALFADEAIRLAAVYSGGVLRDMFHLLRESILIAQYNNLSDVDAVTVRDAIRAVRLKESAGLYAQDITALRNVHLSHELGSVEERRYLDLARVIECYNDRVWFEANPLLWSILKPPARSAGDA